MEITDGAENYSVLVHTSSWNFPTHRSLKVNIGHEFSVRRACGHLLNKRLFSATSVAPATHRIIHPHIDVHFCQFRPRNELAWCAVDRFSSHFESPVITTF